MDLNNSSSNGNGGGIGMSRAAKKRAKKQHKKGGSTSNSSTSKFNQNTQQHQQQQQAFVQKAVTSILKRPMVQQEYNSTSTNTGTTTTNYRSSSIGSKRMKNDTATTSTATSATAAPTKKKTSAAAPDNESTALLTMTIEDIPVFPPNIPVVDYLSVHNTDKNKSRTATTLTMIQNLTAKQRAAALLQAILHPITLHEFYAEYWEKKPLLVNSTAENKHRFQALLSLQSIKAMTKTQQLYYGRDLNVTKYQKDPKDGVKRRITLDRLVNEDDDELHDDHGDAGPGAGEGRGEGAVRVDPTELWSNYDKNGCTIRLLCPHMYSDNVQSLLSTLEMEFSCMVGANAYLTPPNSSQGFAPHYDDIEAFCLQLEGSKRWKVYNPIKGQELPRASSEDFTTDDIRTTIGEPVMDITLNEGDFLYMPRGWIHQACTLKSGSGDHETQQQQHQHSLHLTISAMQQWAWIDMLEIVIPEAVDACAKSETSSSLREGLPRGFMDYMGVMYEVAKDDNLPEPLKKVTETEQNEDESVQKRKLLQEYFRGEAKKRIMKIAKTACSMIDATCDQMAKRFLAERQPPALLPIEKAMTAQGDTSANEKPILPNTLCRLVRPGIGRLVIEDDKAVVYHCADNSREYQGHPISPLEFEMDDGPALEQLLTTAEPAWIVVNDLYHDTIEDKISITQALYDEGILAVRQPEDAQGEVEEGAEMADEDRAVN